MDFFLLTGYKLRAWSCWSCFWHCKHYRHNHRWRCRLVTAREVCVCRFSKNVTSHNYCSCWSVCKYTQTTGRRKRPGSPLYHNHHPADTSTGILHEQPPLDSHKSMTARAEEWRKVNLNFLFFYYTLSSVCWVGIARSAPLLPLHSKRNLRMMRVPLLIYDMLEVDMNSTSRHW